MVSKAVKDHFKEADRWIGRIYNPNGFHNRQDVLDALVFNATLPPLSEKPSKRPIASKQAKRP